MSQHNPSGSMSPIDVEKYLRGVDYPANKTDLVKKAQQNKAPDDIIRTLQQLPSSSFNQPTDVMKAMRKER
jgi:Protein of unknown function (DUF2795)